MPRQFTHCANVSQSYITVVRIVLALNPFNSAAAGPIHCHFGGGCVDELPRCAAK
jgi:hypothetical protein